MEHNFEAACFQCGSSFEIIAPLDLQYCIPREQPKTRDYLSRTYECNKNHHRNAVYWERDDLVIDTGGFSRHFEELPERRERENSDVGLFIR